VRGSNPDGGKRVWSSPKHSWAHPASYSMRSGVLSRGQNGRGVKLTTLQTSAEVKNKGNNTSAPPPPINPRGGKGKSKINPEK